MCRILASVSKEKVSPRRFLEDDRCSLLVQSTAREDKLQKDGWGIAWYEKEWNIEKSPRPVFEEKEEVERIADGKYGLFVAHIRKASNPMNLPVDELCSYENTQPFHHEGWLFAHNGQINHPDKVRETMEEWGQKIRGNNDSEVYFWLLMMYLERYGDVKKALSATVKHLYSVWEKMPEEERAPAPYSALNMVLSDGKKLYVYCGYNGGGKESLCYKDRPYYQMQYLKTEEGFVIASERTSDEDWEPLKDGHLLIAERSGKFRIERLE